MIQIKDLFYLINPKKPNERCIIKNLTLDIEKGEFVIFAGNNGSGKSTLFRILSGELSPNFGQILYNGIDLLKEDRFKRAKFISHVEENLEKGLCPNLTVLENLILSDLKTRPKPIYQRADSKDTVDRIKEIVSSLGVGLENDLYEHVGDLSILKQHAVYLLMCTLSEENELILIDEHIADLDPDSAKKMLTLTAKVIKDKNLTVIMSTHNPYLALKLGTRTIIMNSGEIVFDSKVNGDEKLTPQQILMYFNKHFFV